MTDEKDANMIGEEIDEEQGFDTSTLICCDDCGVVFDFVSAAIHPTSDKGYFGNCPVCKTEWQVPSMTDEKRAKMMIWRGDRWEEHPHTEFIRNFADRIPEGATHYARSLIDHAPYFFKEVERDE